MNIIYFCQKKVSNVECRLWSMDLSLESIGSHFKYLHSCAFYTVSNENVQ